MKPRRRIALTIIGCLAIAGAVVALSLALTPHTAPVGTSENPVAGDPVQGNDTAGSTATPVPTTTPTNRADVAASAAASAAEDVVSATNAMLTKGNGVPPDLTDYTSGFVEGELRALAAERESLGYTQVGKAVITKITTEKAKLTGAHPTVTLNVCIDSSDVDVLDASGKSLKKSLYNPGYPVLNVYGAELISGEWKITTHDIPTKDTCK